MPLYRVFYFREGRIRAVTIAAANEGQAYSKGTNLIKGWADEGKVAFAEVATKGRAKDRAVFLLGEGKIETPQFLLKDKRAKG